MITKKEYLEAKKTIKQYDLEQKERLKNCKHTKTHIYQEYCSHSGRLEYEYIVCNKCGKKIN